MMTATNQDESGSSSDLNSSGIATDAIHKTHQSLDEFSKQVDEANKFEDDKLDTDISMSAESD
jgi:hypothetical protein